jgi:hypothetical protein
MWARFLTWFFKGGSYVPPRFWIQRWLSQRED